MQKLLLFSISCFLAMPSFAQWSVVSSMSANRASHTCTALTNGKVLAAGGYISPNNLTSAELYNPSTDSWAATANSMTVAHTYGASVALANGKGLVTGGYTGTTDTSACDLYDPAANTWMAAAKLSQKRESHSATLLQSGKVLVVGGYNGTLNLASCELYDPTANTWSSAGNLTTGRSFHSAVLLANGKVLVVGGYNPNSGYQLASAELYDPATNSWSTAASMANARDWQAASLLANGKVLVTGGEYFNGGMPFAYNGMTSAELYDPSTNTWSVAANIPAGICYHQQYTLSNGKVLLVAGLNNTNYGTAFTYTAAASYLYNPTTNTWANAIMNFDGRYEMASAKLPNGKVIVTGGLGQSNVEIYTPATTSVGNAFIKASDISVYPNPATDQLKIKIPANVSLNKITGINSTKAANDEFLIDLTNLPAANYVLELQINEQKIVKTFSVVK